MTILEQQGAAAKQAARKLAIAGTAKKNEALEAIARALEVGAPQWLAANAEDMKEAEANGMRPAMLDRLRLTEQRVADIVAAVRQVIALPDKRHCRDETDMGISRLQAHDRLGSPNVCPLSHAGIKNAETVPDKLLCLLHYPFLDS